MAKSEIPAEVLATRWSAPVLATGRPGNPLLCVATTYGLHAALLETDLLPRFLGLRYDSTESERAFIVEREQRLSEVAVHVLVDAAKVDPGQTTLRWSQLPVRIPTGLQHAKVTLLVWERCARVIVGSANLTFSGYRHNREIAGVLDFFDGPDSVPLDVALDTISFLEVLAEFAVAAPKPLRRLLDGLTEARARIRRWRTAPREYGPRKVPRVHFVGGHPRAPSGAPRRSVLDQTLALWGNRRTSHVSVVTPFVGEVTGAENPVAAKLAALPRSSDCFAALAVPGHLSADGEDSIVELPKSFLIGWAKAWGVAPEDVPVHVPPRTRKGENRTRDLHAKTLSLESEDDDRSLLLAGSSNFSLHGMGVRVPSPNAEANLCYVADLEDGLGDVGPIDWAANRVEDAIWPNEPDVEPGEDAPTTSDPLPAVFRWATLDQQRSIVTLGLDPRAPLPDEWSVRLPAKGSADASVLMTSNQAPDLSEDGTLRMALPEELRNSTLTSIRVDWLDDDGERCSAALPLQVVDLCDLLPPEDFRGLTADAILEALLSGREPADLYDGLELETEPHSLESALDPLRTIQTSHWTLYRVRRLGRALGGLGARLMNTVRTPEAVAYRLSQDPLGPLQLAQALVREWLPAAETRAEREPIVFGIAEIALTVVTAGARVHAEREAGDPDLRPHFKAAARSLFEMCVEHAPSSGAAEVITYMREVRALAHKRLG